MRLFLDVIGALLILVGVFGLGAFVAREVWERRGASARSRAAAPPKTK